MGRQASPHCAVLRTYVRAEQAGRPELPAVRPLQRTVEGGLGRGRLLTGLQGRTLWGWQASPRPALIQQGRPREGSESLPVGVQGRGGITAAPIPPSHFQPAKYVRT